MLSRATTILVMKDSITEEDFEEADILFVIYVTEFERLFGVQNMRYNIHILLHVVKVCRLLGPCYVHSTFQFESCNLKIRKHIQSMKDPLNQIVTRHLILDFVRGVSENPEISE